MEKEKVCVEDIFTGARAAKLLGVSHQLVRQWVALGYIKPLPIEGSMSHLYLRSDLERMRDRRTARGRYPPDESKPSPDKKSSKKSKAGS